MNACSGLELLIGGINLEKLPYYMLRYYWLVLFHATGQDLKKGWVAIEAYIFRCLGFLLHF